MLGSSGDSTRGCRLLRLCKKSLGDLTESEVSNPALFASEIVVLLPDTLQHVANSSIIAASGVQSVTN